MCNRSLKINAILNMVRKGCAILFPIITFSYASHKLGADGIGAYSFSNSVISYLLLIAALGIATYAVREGQAYRDDEATLKRFISEVYTINILMTLVSYFILGILLLFWHKLSGYKEIILILSVSIILTTVGADWINTLLEDYLFITIRFIVVQLICLVVLVLIVKGPGDLYKYAAIGMLSSVGGNILNIVHIRRKIRFHITCKPNFRKHMPPMLTLFSNNLAMKIYLLADVTILGVFMTNADVGYYSAASKIYTSVKEMLNALILVTVPRFSYFLSHNDTVSYKKSYIGVLNSVGTLIFPSVIGLLFQADNILFFLGGKDYINGTSALHILSVAMLFAVAACLFSQSVLIPYKQEKYFLRATIVSALTNIVFNFILIPSYGINAAALTTLVSEIIVCVMALLRARIYLKSALIVTSDLKSSAIGALAVAIICLILRYTIRGRLVNLISSVILSCVAYFIITYLLKNSTVRNGVSNMTTRMKRLRH